MDGPNEQPSGHARTLVPEGNIAAIPGHNFGKSIIGYGFSQPGAVLPVPVAADFGLFSTGVNRWLQENSAAASQSQLTP